MAPLVGRAALLGEVAELLGRGVSVALCGPVGVGRSALLDALDGSLTAEGTAVARCAGAPDEADIPFGALRDLLGQAPADLVARMLEALPAAARDAFEAGYVAGPPDEGLRAALSVAFHELAGRWTADRPVVLLLDDVQWLDEASSTVVAYARRRTDGLRVVAAVAEASGGQADPATLPTVAELTQVEVPPLDDVATVALLRDAGLGPDLARRVHRECGGVPALALALAGAVGERPQVLGAPTPLPVSVERVLRDRFLRHPEGVRATLVDAALMHHPTVRDLVRAGRLDAEDDVRRAAAAGLVALGSTGLRFTPSALRDLVAGSVPATARAERHRALADRAVRGPDRLRHVAHADPSPDADLACELAEAAATSAAAGDRALGAELFLLAADRAPLELAGERADWLVGAAETAAPANLAEVVQRALGDARTCDLTPQQRVRLRLTIPELAGNGVALLDEVLTAALADAGEDDALVARVLLQRARIALMEGRPRLTRAAAAQAVSLLERTDDTQELARALTTLAVAERWVGGDHRPVLARAVTLEGGSRPGFLHVSAEYMHARSAFYDDRLDEAWTRFGRMLAEVGPGAGMDRVHVLRCLVEVAARTGRCADALAYAARADEAGTELGIEAHAGWFISSVAELVGGGVGRALELARHGAEAAEERGDVRYLMRHLIVLGQALHRSGDTAGAWSTYARVRGLEEQGDFADPTVNRWHADAAVAAVALGRPDDAAEVLDLARAGVARQGGAPGLSAQLDRAEAELLLFRGDLAAADALLDRAEQVAREHGLAIDVGRTLVVRSHLERRRRRVAASREALEQALAHFTALRAAPWVERVTRELAPEPASGGAALDGLTETEQRIARAVAAGLSNREIAEQVFVSVKTVEANLTRVYRKLGVRSRTQLASLVGPD
ncbi:MAG: LuxR family transcriptional regulator [Nocardioides sp.]|nr:LuxR family transcriptional regulator [Nocardioides sp.]